MLHIRKYLMGSAVLFLLFAQGTVCAEPVAPLLEMTPQGLKLTKAQGKTPADVTKEIPTRDSIDLPIYPGSFFASSVEGSSQGTIKMLPAINLVSTDPPEKVKSWYRANLQNWTYSDRFDLFHSGAGEIDMENLMAIPTITIVDESDPGLDLMFYKTEGLRSRIVLRYKPQ